MSPLRRVTAIVSAVALLLGGSFLISTPAMAAPGDLDVTAAPYNAVGDGVVNDGPAIQQALDDADGTGKTVLLPAGYTFLTGGIVVGSNTTLQIEGTVLQSQNPAHFTYVPLVGFYIPPTPLCPSWGSCIWEKPMFHNMPLIHAGEQHDVTITGNGTIQMMRDAANPIATSVIGFHKVSNFEISNLTILDAYQYNLAIFTSDHGLIKNLTILAVEDVAGEYYGNDGVSMMNSQHIRVTGNYIRNGDDGIYVGSNFNDPRAYQHPDFGNLWWTFAETLPATDIEIDNNEVAHTPGMAVGFIAWGTGSPDPAKVAISNVRIHDNILTSSTRAVGCWCDNPNFGHNTDIGEPPFTGSDTDNQSSITNVRIYDNVYNSPGNQAFTATDMKTDYGALSSNTFINGDFDEWDITWWSSVDDAGIASAADPAVLNSAQAQTALAGADGRVGFVQSDGTQSSQVFQGLGLNGAPAGLPFMTRAYEVSVDVITGANAARLFAYNTCTSEVIAQKAVTATTARTEILSFEMLSDCDDVQIGVETVGFGESWALIDNLSISNIPSSTSQAIDDVDPVVSYSGAWGAYTNTLAWAGTNAVGFSAGSAFSIPFTGVRAVLQGLVDSNLGTADIYLDGVFIKTIDFYAPSLQVAQLFDTGEIDAGEHVLELVMTGLKNPLATDVYVVFDVLFLQPAALASDDPPVASSMSPSSGSMLGGTVVTVTGEGFIGATGLNFGGVAASDFVVVDDETISAIAPAHAVGSVDVVVTHPNGDSEPLEFAFLDVTTIASVSPSQGVAAGGTEVTVIGTCFVGAESVWFGEIEAASFTVQNDTEIRAIAPAGAVGATDIRVVGSSACGTVSSANAYQYITAGEVDTPVDTPAANPDVAQVLASTGFAGGVAFLIAALLLGAGLFLRKKTMATQ